MDSKRFSVLQLLESYQLCVKKITNLVVYIEEYTKMKSNDKKIRN